MSRRHSKIDRLPEEVRDWIARLSDQGRTLDEIISKLRELDLDALPSRSGLHRHLQKAEEVAERIRKSRAVADVIVRRLGEADPDKTTRMNIELMHNVLFQIASRTTDDAGEPVTFEPMEAMLLAKALDHLGKAAKDDVARTVTIEKRAAEKARAEAAKAVEAVGDASGLTAATVEAIKAKILGIQEAKR
jgi:ribosomal protein L14